MVFGRRCLAGSCAFFVGRLMRARHGVGCVVMVMVGHVPTTVLDSCRLRYFMIRRVSLPLLTCVNFDVFYSSTPRLSNDYLTRAFLWCIQNIVFWNRPTLEWSVYSINSNSCRRRLFGFGHSIDSIHLIVTLNRVERGRQLGLLLTRQLITKVVSCKSTHDPAVLKVFEKTEQIVALM